MKADLHVHTTASDGTDSPEEVVAKAASIGLGCLAITDHDTIKGIKPAIEAGKKYKVEIIPAVELSAEYDGKETHILGYMIDVENQALNSKLSFLCTARENRIYDILRSLKKINIDLDFDRVSEIAGGGSIGRPHIAMAMIEQGIVSTLDEAFGLYIGEGKPGFIPRYKLSTAQAVKIIRNAGGVAVLAHPGDSFDEKLISSLIKEGVQGIEAHHPSHKPETSELYVKICKSYGLVATGGSDYHGEGRNSNFLGSCTVDGQTVDRLKSLAKSGKQ